MKKRVLVIGATGVMGSYVVPELLNLGYEVTAVSLDEKLSTRNDLRYIKADCFDIHVLKEILNIRYDAIIDYMTYCTFQFAERFELLLNSTDHFIFLSSYRVYSDYEIPTVETSPRLLDVVSDKEFLESDDYSLFKAREENIIRSSKYRNWTIIRPAITYSNQRFQLMTLEAPQILRRAQEGKTLYVLDEALDVPATMTWSGDVAKMVARLVLNPKAYKETFTVSTAEYHTWREIADYYKELVGLKYEAVDINTYLNFFGNTLTSKFQLKYDRCQRRIMDNSKILEITGLKQSDFMTLKEGLAKEIANLPETKEWPDTEAYRAMDKYEASLKND